jgi:hypothetical protein
VQALLDGPGEGLVGGHGEVIGRMVRIFSG